MPIHLSMTKIATFQIFLDVMHSSLLLPHIFSPTRTTSSSATLINNIFTNNYNSSFVSGNLSHYPFLPPLPPFPTHVILPPMLSLS